MLLTFLIIVTVVHTIDPDDYEDLVVGGNTTDISRFKFIVCLVYLMSPSANVNRRDEPFCGGSIIRRYWVLTAAHCLFKRQPDLKKGAVAVRGNTSYCKTGENRIDHAIVEYKLHQQYDEVTHDYDIALLKVKQPFVGVNENVIKLVPSNYNYKAGDIAYTLGWGKTLSNSSTVNQLRYVDIKIIDLKECKRMWNSQSIRFKVTPRNMCAGWKHEKGSCGGDSGGPLIDKDRLLIGVVSWGPKTCEHAFPTVFVKVALFNKWLNSEVEKERRLHQYL